MKKILLFTALILACSPHSWGQEKLFELTKSGFVSTNAETPTYSVVNFDGVSQQELFDKILVTVNSLYISPQDVISKVDGKSITVNGFSENAVSRTKFHHFDLNYTLNFEFRDGRVRVNAPATNRISNILSDKVQEMFVCEKVISITGDSFTIFKPKDGSLNLQMAKETLESHINKVINTILFSRSHSEEW